MPGRRSICKDSETSLPVHHSREATGRERGDAFGRARGDAVGHTVAVYRRLFAEVHPGASMRELGAQVVLPPAAQEELAGLAAGAGVDELELRAVNARTEILAGAGPTECSVIGAGGLLAQNWDWHPDLAPSTVVWVVAPGDGTWFATVTEAGLLGKLGLNDAGLGVCLNLLATTADGGSGGTPIHVLLRQVLAGCRSVGDAVALLTAATVTASSAVTVATPGDVATVELSPGGANVLRGAPATHTNHFLLAPRAGADTLVGEPGSTLARLEVIRRGMPLLDALRSHEGHPNSVCRHVDPADAWADRTATLASVVMNLSARRLHVAPGPPCTHEHVQVDLPPVAAVA